MNEQERQDLIQELLTQIKLASQDVTELEEVKSLDGVKTLPAMRGTELVTAPVGLLVDAFLATEVGKTLDLKADKASTYTKTEADALLADKASVDVVLETAEEQAKEKASAVRSDVRRYADELAAGRLYYRGELTKFGSGEDSELYRSEVNDVWRVPFTFTYNGKRYLGGSCVVVVSASNNPATFDERLAVLAPEGIVGVLEFDAAMADVNDAIREVSDAIPSTDGLMKGLRGVTPGADTVTVRFNKVGNHSTPDTLTLSAATPTTAGVMTAADKARLDGLGAACLPALEVNIYNEDIYLRNSAAWTDAGYEIGIFRLLPRLSHQMREIDQDCALNKWRFYAGTDYVKFPGTHFGSGIDVEQGYGHGLAYVLLYRGHETIPGPWKWPVVYCNYTEEEDIVSGLYTLNACVKNGRRAKKIWNPLAFVNYTPQTQEELDFIEGFRGSCHGKPSVCRLHWGFAAYKRDEEGIVVRQSPVARFGFIVGFDKNCNTDLARGQTAQPFVYAVIE